MLPLIFILMTTTLSIITACKFLYEVTWFAYYLGGISGMLISSVLLACWNKRYKKDNGLIPVKKKI